MVTQTQTITKRLNITSENIMRELADIKNQLGKFILLIPEESLEEYKNASQIRKAYLRARKSK